MRAKDDTRTATSGPAVTPKVAPRFTRAAQAERSRLAGKREQLLRKREAAQAEVARIDRAVGGVDELLELLAPLLAGNGSEPEEAAGEDGGAGADSGASKQDEACESDRAQPAQQ